MIHGPGGMSRFIGGKSHSAHSSVLLPAGIESGELDHDGRVRFDDSRRPAFEWRLLFVQHDLLLRVTDLFLMAGNGGHRQAGRRNVFFERREEG